MAEGHVQAVEACFANEGFHAREVGTNRVDGQQEHRQHARQAGRT